MVALFYKDGGFMQALQGKFKTLTTTITGATDIPKAQ
ncbi:hypothetical protein AAUPMB_21877 [Pasteurella multocida subsp. multocida str. Anand1_buffalo]|nr:hypothetical protein AAUPMB_21877 [Pasteurella multocida subsp. multocida str. Anand1_buffalo]